MLLVGFVWIKTGKFSFALLIYAACFFQGVEFMPLYSFQSCVVLNSIFLAQSSIYKNSLLTVNLICSYVRYVLYLLNSPSNLSTLSVSEIPTAYDCNYERSFSLHVRYFYFRLFMLSSLFKIFTLFVAIFIVIFKTFGKFQSAYCHIHNVFENPISLLRLTGILNRT